VRKIIKFVFCSLTIASYSVYASEGMWTLDNLPRAQLKSEYDFAPDDAWVNHVMHASVQLSMGCSGSFVSASGLVMTNHHCAHECLASLSDAQHDYVAKGFLARRPEEEVKCPDVALDRLDTIADVTDSVKKATAGLDGAAFHAKMTALTADLTSQCEKATAGSHCKLVTLYHGGRYQIYRYHHYSDVRMVFAPELAIAFFGGDPDNFNFPRYDLDLSMMRAYENGKPAATPEFFPFDIKGAEPGEAVFVTGNPGSTQRELTVAQLDNERRFVVVDLIARLSEMQGVLEQFSKTSPENARIAEPHLFYDQNGLKVFKGWYETLSKPSVIAAKLADEARLKAYVAAHPELAAQVGDPWGDIERAEVSNEALLQTYNFEEKSSLNSDLFSYARHLVRAAAERAKPNSERLPEYSDSALIGLQEALFAKQPIYPQFETTMMTVALTNLRANLGPDSAYVQTVLGKESPEQLATRLVSASTLADPAVRHQLWNGGMAAILASHDPMIQLALKVDPAARAIRKRYEDEVTASIQKATEKIAVARFAMSGTSVYPDATLTLRLSPGVIKGWHEGDHEVAPYTDFAGAFARSTGSAPFKLPDSWVAAKAQGQLTLTQRFDQVTTNDIVGGNSGSPLINRKAQLVGLVFDGNIHSIGGNFAYDEIDNRTVSVNSGAIVEALRHIYDANFLADELLKGSPKP